MAKSEVSRVAGSATMNGTQVATARAPATTGRSSARGGGMLDHGRPETSGTARIGTNITAQGLAAAGERDRDGRGTHPVGGDQPDPDDERREGDGIVDVRGPHGDVTPGDHHQSGGDEAGEGLDIRAVGSKERDRVDQNERDDDPQRRGRHHHHSLTPRPAQRRERHRHDDAERPELELGVVPVQGEALPVTRRALTDEEVRPRARRSARRWRGARAAAPRGPPPRARRGSAALRSHAVAEPPLDPTTGVTRAT